MGCISVTIILLIIFDALLLVYMNRKIYRKKMASKILDVSVHEEQNLYQKINEMYKDSQIMRHDVKHYLTVVLGLIRNEEYEEAKKQLIDILGTEFRGKFVYYQSSNVVNAVLNDKRSYCEDHKISFDLVASGDVPGYCEMDIAIILANLLDNAIEASTTGHDEIYVELLQNKGMYSVMVKNSISQSVLQANSKLVSSKYDADNTHGFGIKSIKKLANRLDGTYQYYEEHGYFVSYVSIPCNRDSSTK